MTVFTDREDILFKLNIGMDFQEVYKDSGLNLTKLAFIDFDLFTFL